MPFSDHPNFERRQLREEIAYLEARLVEIGCEGDCAYERSLGRYYDNLLVQRRQELQQLNRGLPRLDACPVL